MTEAEKNRSSLIAYFESGSKENDRKLGVEVEHFIIVTSDGTPFTYAAQGSIPGVHEVLEHLLSTYPIIYQNSEGELIGSITKDEEETIVLIRKNVEETIALIFNCSSNAKNFSEYEGKYNLLRDEPFNGKVEGLDAAVIVL